MTNEWDILCELNSAEKSDANGDGEVNLMELATAQIPLTATLTQPALVRNGATLEFTYTRSLVALADAVLQANNRPRGGDAFTKPGVAFRWRWHSIG